MTVVQPDLTRLKSQLLSSGLQQKDTPLFQVINQLIDSVKQLQTNINSSISGLSGDNSHALLDGKIDKDTFADAPIVGDLIVAQQPVAIKSWYDGIPSDRVYSTLTQGNQTFWFDGIPSDGIDNFEAVWKRLAAGTPGQMLVMAGNLPAWSGSFDSVLMPSWIILPLLNDWQYWGDYYSPSDESFNRPGYRYDSTHKLVFLKGLVRSPSNAQNTLTIVDPTKAIAQLPIGYRPQKGWIFASGTKDFSGNHITIQVRMTPDGYISVWFNVNANVADQLSLDGICFALDI